MHVRCVLYRLRFVLVPVLIAVAVPLVGVVLLFIVGKWFFYPGSTKLSELASGPRAPIQDIEPVIPVAPEPGSSSGNPTTEPETPPVPQPEKAGPFPTLPESEPGPTAKPLERYLPQRPAEPGIYETLRPTVARTQPNDSAAVADEIGSNARLNVIGSNGNWLIVRSNKLQATVYIKRDHAMFLPGEKPSELFEEKQARWKKVEAEIYEAFNRWNVTGVTVTFIEETAYLRGQVKTDQERFRAGQATRTIPEVMHIENGIGLGR